MHSTFKFEVTSRNGRTQDSVQLILQNAFRSSPHQIRAKLFQKMVLDEKSTNPWKMFTGSQTDLTSVNPKFPAKDGVDSLAIWNWELPRLNTGSSPLRSHDRTLIPFAFLVSQTQKTMVFSVKNHVYLC